jgi:hypothetical protein
VSDSFADVHYFSNGSEHADWESRWCDRCTRDVDQSCPHALNLVTLQADPVFSRNIHGRIVCAAFAAGDGDTP